MFSRTIGQFPFKRLTAWRALQAMGVVLLTLIVVSFPSSTPQAVTYPDAFWRGEY